MRRLWYSVAHPLTGRYAEREVTPMIETKNLILRKVELNDIDLYREMLSCPITTKYLPNEGPYSDKQITEYVANRVAHWQHGFGTFTIVEQQTNEKIGYVGVEILTDPTKSDIRFGILRTKNGHGFAKEAGLKCLEYTFSLGLHNQIYGVAVTANIASIRTLLNLGMQKIENVKLYDCEGLEYLVIDRKAFKIDA